MQKAAGLCFTKASGLLNYLQCVCVRVQRPLFLCKVADLDSRTDAQGAEARLFIPYEHPQKGRLPRAGAARQHEQLGGTDLEGHVVQHVDDAGNVSFNTVRGRAKPRHIERDPRVSLMVVNPSNAYHWVGMTGTAGLVDEGADAQIDKLAKKYLDVDTYPLRQEGEQRVRAPITLERVEARGFDDD